MKKVAIAVIAIVLVGAVIAWVLVVGIISPFNPVPRDYRGLSISVEIAGGMPVGGHQFEIDGYGDVSYERGEYSGSWTSVKGSAKISPQQVQELVAAIKKTNLWALKDSYSIGRIVLNDNPTVDLSITFNGWSKHISYYEGMCAGQEPQEMDPAPQALCDLQRMIEAIGQPAIPTPRPWPTATPAPSPTPAPPTSTPPAIMRAGDFGILSQEPCGPPCFLGIRPGITTFDEATLILQNAGAPCAANTTGQLWCQSGGTLISVSGERTVDRIDLAAPAKITLGDLMARYGPPNSLVLDTGLPTFLYHGLQIFVFLAWQPSHSYAVTPGTTITGVSYLAAAEYQRWARNAENYQQPWKGYGTYAPKINP